MSAELAIHRPDAQRMGFFTDTTTCIGCKACEVACKQWNDLPADGNDYGKRRHLLRPHEHALGLDLAPRALRRDARALAGDADHADARPGRARPRRLGRERRRWLRISASAFPEQSRWLFMSDVCKHCTHAGCLDACPTGALIRTEFETVILQPDVCNGCGYCVPACPFGVVARDPDDGRAAKCTLCYDRLEDGLEPACAKACPTDSITFGPYDELLDVAERRVNELHGRGLDGAYLYGADEQMAGGLGAFFLLTAPPERFGLPAEADSPIQENVVPATVAAVGAGLTAAAGVALAFVAAARKGRR